MSNPYYIVAPRYIRTSAGCRVLYKLCDLINRSGGVAFIYLRPHLSFEVAGSPMDVAPFLTEKIVSYHYEAGITPIVIYPETFKIANFSAPFRIRYVLNYDQLLSANEPIEKDDYVLAYSGNISSKLDISKPTRVLFLPVSDPSFYDLPSNENQKRRGGVFYAGKYKYHFGGKTFPLTNGMPEITRDKSTSQRPEQIRDLFQCAEFFYCYEDSALAVEAILCGCPVVFLPNEYFNEALGAKELKGLGYAWGDSPEQLAHAKNTVVAARERYLDLLNEASQSVKSFIEETQLCVKDVEYKVPFASEYLRDPSLVQLALDYCRFFREVIEDNGLKKTISIIFKRLRARRFKIY
jgi:hypothetical protein